MSRLDELAAELRTLVDDLVSRLGAEPATLQDTAQDCDPQQPDRSFLWLYQVRAGRREDAADVLRGQLADELRASGWRTTARDTDTMIAMQFERDGTDVGVTMALTSGGDVIVGGSTACVPTSS